MSHHPERKEKNCLNCGTKVIGRFCHHCGQENIDTRESFWSLMKDFVFDIIHFDGKFVHTIKYIFARPGFVARQYAEGKRATYLHPIRMYLFTSAVFFLIFFTLGKNSLFMNSTVYSKLEPAERKELAAVYRDSLEKHPGDTGISRSLTLLLDSSRTVTSNDLHPLNRNRGFRMSGKDYSTLREYDSAQLALPSSERDGWFSRMMEKKQISINEKYKGHPEEATEGFAEIFMHRLPYLLFLSLPFFALILKLLYVRRKNFYYSDHAIFTLYHYILSFILLLLIIGLTQLRNIVGWYPIRYIGMAVFISWPVYLVLEMKYFYRQGWIKTLGKFLLLNFLGMIVLLILFLFFLFLSILQM